MANVTLQIFIVGMVAFSSNDANSPTAMEVYLPKGDPSDTHHAFLLYDQNQWNVQGSDCDQASDLSNALGVTISSGACTDVGEIAISGLSGNLMAQMNGCTDLPSNQLECGYFCWVPKMRDISDGKAYKLELAEDWWQGHVTIDHGSLTTFDLATYEPWFGGALRLVAFVRRENGNPFSKSGWEHAVAEIVLWTVDATDPKIELPNGSTLTYKSNGSPATLVIGNLPERPHTDTFIAAHFGRYYGIADPSTGSATPYLPSLRLSLFQNDTESTRCPAHVTPELLKPFDERIGPIRFRIGEAGNLEGRAIFQRPICPQAAFEQ